MANPLYGQNKADSEIANSSDVSSYQKEATQHLLWNCHLIELPLWVL